MLGKQSLFPCDYYASSSPSSSSSLVSYSAGPGSDMVTLTSPIGAAKAASSGSSKMLSHMSLIYGSTPPERRNLRRVRHSSIILAHQVSSPEIWPIVRSHFESAPACLKLLHVHHTLWLWWILPFKDMTGTLCPKLSSKALAISLHFGQSPSLEVLTQSCYMVRKARFMSLVHAMGGIYTNLPTPHFKC